MAFDHSRRRWFETGSCKPIPRGLPSSAKQLRTSLAYSAVLVLVAHYSRYPGQVDLFRLARHQIYGFAVYRTFETESSAPFLKLRDRGIPESGIPYCATSK
jgi:hypothetical protein